MTNRKRKQPKSIGEWLLEWYQRDMEQEEKKQSASFSKSEVEKL